MKSDTTDTYHPLGSQFFLFWFLIIGIRYKNMRNYSLESEFEAYFMKIVFSLYILKMINPAEKISTFLTIIPNSLLKFKFIHSFPDIRIELPMSEFFFHLWTDFSIFWSLDFQIRFIHFLCQNGCLVCLVSYNIKLSRRHIVLDNASNEGSLIRKLLFFIINK